MEKRELDTMVDMIDAEIKASGMSRRDALKVGALGGAAALMLNAGEAKAATAARASGAKGKILIVGGGLAGVATAAKLSNELSDPDITIIEPNDISVSYQPGQTLVASGVWKKDDIIYHTADFMPEGVKWIKDKAATFDPENNKVVTAGGQTLSYDYMVVATGLQLDYGKIKGLESVGTILSLDEKGGQAARQVLGKNGATSLYFADGSEDTWTEMQKFIADAKSGKKVTGVFTHPNTPIKCGGAPKKIMYLTDARLREAGARDNAELHFYPNGTSMFGVPEYHDAIVKQYEERNMKWSYAHNLVAVDTEKKVATFDHHWKEKGKWDADLELYEEVVKHEMVEVPYDFIHITPPMAAPSEVATSPIGSAKGWVPVTKETLQHVKYPNVFALGDVAAVPMGKTGGSARKQYKVVCENMIALMEGKKMESQYDGYTVCPLITGLGTVMLAEFNWTKKPTPSFPLDPTKERWIMWFLKVYMLKPMTVYGMLKGRA